MLDARGAISVTERQRYILRVRTLARSIAQSYVAARAKLGFPMAEPHLRDEVLAQLKAQVEAEQKAIDICGKYPSSRFGSLPTDIPGSPLCSRAARFVAPKPPFVGDFGNVADRIAHGNKVCCP